MDSKRKELLTVRAKWYAKLRKEGFDDIEQDEDNLKIWHSRYFLNKYSTTTYTAKEEYYRMAGKFLHDHTFDTAQEKLIWSLHTDGMSQRNIVTALKKHRIYLYTRAITKTIKKLSSIMLAHLKK